MEDNLQNSKTAGNNAKVLIPVDFSTKGQLALKVGFELARRLSKDVTLLHASVMAEPGAMPEFPDDFNGLDNENYEIEEMEMNEEVHRIDTDMMGRLKAKIKKLQAAGEFPDIPFDTVLAPGMPEEVISEYCVATPPEVVVMATRCCDRRREELIGSVTAEVIDHCRAAVFTVPESYTFAGFKEIVRICCFCNFDEGDFQAVDKLMKMFGGPSVKIFLFPANEKFKGAELQNMLKNLNTLLQSAFQNSEFSVPENISGSNLREEAESFFIREKIQMILAPNRKRSAIARFFHPGLAHKILYEIDFPMLAIPV